MPRRIAIVQPLLLAMIIALGFGTIWAVLIGWGFNTAIDVLGPEAVHEYVRFRTDGTPVVVVLAGKYSRYSEDRTYHTLEGNPIAISQQEAWLSEARLAGPRRENQSSVPSWYADVEWSKRMAGYNDSAQPMIYWYFLLDGELSGGGYFVGFDSTRKHRVGYIGRNGFQPAMPSPEERFPVHNHKIAREAAVGSHNGYGYLDAEPDMRAYSEGPGCIPGWIVHVLTDDGVVQVDLLRRSSRVVLREVGLMSAGRLNRGFPSPVTRDSPKYVSELKELLAVRATDRVLLLDSSGKLESSFTIPTDLRNAEFQFLLLNDKSAVLQLSAQALGRAWPRGNGQDRVVWIDPQGRTFWQKDYSLKNWDPCADNSLFSPWRTAMCDLAPLVVTTISSTLQPWLYVWHGQEPTYLSALARSWSDFWPAMIAVSLLAVILASLCYRRQHKYGLPWTGVWTAFVLLFGLPAYLGYLAHRTWPARLPCPHCGRRVPRDRPACFACGQEFPPPQRKGIEVFA